MSTVEVDFKFLKKFDHFSGKMIHHNKDVLKRAMVGQDKSVESIQEELEKICASILAGDLSLVNKLRIDYMTDCLMSSNPAVINDVMIRAYDVSTKQLFSDIKTRLAEGTFTLAWFVDKYRNYFDHSQRLKLYFSSFDLSISRVSDSKYSHINLIRSFMFYHNVIKETYEVGEKSLHFFGMLSYFIENNVKNIDHIIPFLQMYQYYRRLASSMENETTLAIDDEFLSHMGSNLEFTKSLATRIHSYLMRLATISSTESPEYKAAQASLMDIARIVERFEEKSMFNICYYSLLIERLVNHNFNTDLERKVLAFFADTNDNTYTMMKYLLEDAKKSGNHQKIYRRVKISVKSDQYASLDMAKFDRAVFKPKILRYYACPNIKDSTKYNLPPQLQIHLDVFNAYFGMRNLSKIKLTWELDYGRSMAKSMISQRGLINLR